MQADMCGFEDFFALKISILLYRWMAVGLCFERKYSLLIYLIYGEFFHEAD